MDADLVSSPGVENRFEQRRSAQALEHVVRGSRRSAHILIHGHAFAMRGMPGDGGTDFTALSLNVAANNCVIRLVHASAGELGRKGKVSIVVFRDHKAAAGFFVEPVHNAGARDTANAAELSAAMME